MLMACRIKKMLTQIHVLNKFAKQIMLIKMNFLHIYYLINKKSKCLVLYIIRAHTQFYAYLYLGFNVC